MILFLLTLFHNPASDITSPLKKRKPQAWFPRIHWITLLILFHPPPPLQTGCSGDTGSTPRAWQTDSDYHHPLLSSISTGCEQVRARADKDVCKAGQHKCFQEANSGESIEICIGNIASPGRIPLSIAFKPKQQNDFMGGRKKKKDIMTCGGLSVHIVWG